MTNEDFNKNMSRMFFRLEEVCDIMIEHYEEEK